MTSERIPFKIDTQRVIELLGKQLYQSPLALLRENTQNAYDALLLRRQADPSFTPAISISIAPDEVSVTDNGIGMTAEDLRNHFWFAGSSSKNNDSARAAGVVGTFGIGAMANFGIASELIVETESHSTGTRTRSAAFREKLTLNHDCIDLETVDSRGVPGTTVTARVLPAHRINVAEAKSYVADFVALLDIPVTVNGVLVSQQPIERFVPLLGGIPIEEKAACAIGPRLVADISIAISKGAEIRLELRRMVWSGQAIRGSLTLRSGASALRTCRSGFGLATASVGSQYQFGGVADLLHLQPTAGREALTSESLQFLQSVFSELDAFVSTELSVRPESDSSTPFMQWVVSHARYELCGLLQVTLHPNSAAITLQEMRDRTKNSPVLLYTGNDQGAITRNSSDERPLLVLARSNPRRQCEAQFLARYCQTEAVSDNPKVERIKPMAELSLAEKGLAFRIESILESEYFLKARITFGAITHGLPMLVSPSAGCVDITLDPNGQTVSLILGLYDREFAAFGSMTKDFVRTALFPRVSDYVPSSTRNGAEAFLKMLRGKKREVFEYEDSETGSFSSIWDDYAEGKITMEQAVQRSVAVARSSVQVVDNHAAARIRDVVPDVVQNEEAVAQAGEPTLIAVPPIMRTETSSNAKLLTIPDAEPALRGYRCFLAISDKVREDLGEFFLQPHKTSIVWGGQKVLFIFIHHSERFGLYYDLQTTEPVGPDTGGLQTPTCTLVLKDKIYVPIPALIRGAFVPLAGEKKRFEVKGDILRTESDGGS